MRDTFVFDMEFEDDRWQFIILFRRHSRYEIVVSEDEGGKSGCGYGCKLYLFH